MGRASAVERGESAGAWAVRTLLSAPSARGLFQRAIIQSAGYEDYAFQASPTIELAHTAAERFFDRLGTSELGWGVEVILDGGPSNGSLASTIVDCTGTRPRVLREGAISVAQLKGVLEGLGTELETDPEPDPEPDPDPDPGTDSA